MNGLSFPFYTEITGKTLEKAYAPFIIPLEDYCGLYVGFDSSAKEKTE